MNLNAYTLKSQELVQAAQQLAQAASHAQIDNDHFLSALLEVDSLQFVYDQCQLNLPLVRQLAEKNLESKAKVEGGQLSLSAESSRLLTAAQNIAKEMKDEFVAVEHILQALITGKSNWHKSNAAQLLKDQGLTTKQVRDAIAKLAPRETRDLCICRKQLPILVQICQEPKSNGTGRKARPCHWT